MLLEECGALNRWIANTLQIAKFGCICKGQKMAKKSPRLDDESYFHSLDCEIVWLYEPGDTTVRPILPSLLEHAKAERAKILAAQALQNQTPPQDSKQA